ncbi:response regulator transcription factor [Derxia gummosa]|uniref:Response regulator transcription factor n=1 Tax=Derxia gummosa DSM 723 TaxID=1121388 RepID=A0A8B6X626_9BURK|nr:response regulator transcription factor [Derxia gummosa]
MHLLLLEDDPLLGEALRDFLRAEGHTVDWLTRLSQARAALPSPYDALLVDWQLPDGSGLDWIRGLRAAGNATPILLLTARDRVPERIEGLDAGADDYLVKPFAPEELAARVRAAARRGAGQTTPRLVAGPVSLDPAARRAWLGETELNLTAREWALLEALARRAGRVVPRADLEQMLWGFDGELSSNAVEVHLSNLRKKIGRDTIETVRGLGYRMAGRA